ncbi:MAG: TetR/AcrR family transcriptional regulator [Novosphingobium sp.]|nr:TetR/AcrR family transcriptional regulator [Novosphingobium sp.]
MGNKAIEAEAPRRGPRPGARSPLQQAQRAASRRAIVAALRGLIGDKPYDVIAIDDILAAASVSRATFYRHFKAKRDVALALYEAVMAGSLDHFRALGALRPGDHAAAVKWVEGLVAIYRGNGAASALILQLGASDPVIHRRLRADRQWLIAELAALAPGFAATRGDSEAAQRARVRADLWLVMLDRVCVEIAVHEPLPLAGHYIERVAEELGGLPRPIERPR